MIWILRSTIKNVNKEVFLGITSNQFKITSNNFNIPISVKFKNTKKVVIIGRTRVFKVLAFHGLSKLLCR